MRKTLRILCLALAIFLPACGQQSEVTEVATHSPSTTTTWSYIPPPISQTTTTVTPKPIVATTTTVKPKPIHSPKVYATSAGVWDLLAACESGGRWNLNAYFDGGLQFAPSTWTAYIAAGKPYAMVGYPAYAYQASREMQIAVATRVRDGVNGSTDPYLNPQGYGAWPTCRHRAGV